MRFEHSVIGERLGSFENSACTGIALLHLLLLRVRQRKYTQAEHFIHLRAIEEVARLDGIIERLLDFARPVRVNCVNTDISQLAKSATSLIHWVD